MYNRLVGEGTICIRLKRMLDMGWEAHVAIKEYEMFRGDLSNPERVRNRRAASTAMGVVWYTVRVLFVLSLGR
jgi:hypothetical protein